MNVKAFLFEEDRGVSPVIGVILMVAITVILAAVIATFVLGLGEQISDTAPQASFDYSLDNDPAGAPTSNLSITHTGGDTLDAGRLTIYAPNGTTTVDFTAASPGSNDVKAGVTAYVENVTSGDTVQIIWTSDSGDQSAVLSEW